MQKGDKPARPKCCGSVCYNGLPTLFREVLSCDVRTLMPDLPYCTQEGKCLLLWHVQNALDRCIHWNPRLIFIWTNALSLISPVTRSRCRSSSWRRRGNAGGLATNPKGTSDHRLQRRQRQSCGKEEMNKPCKGSRGTGLLAADRGGTR